VNLSEIVERFGSSATEVVAESDGWVIKCPSHSDENESLRLAVTADDRLLVKCRAGCSTQSVIEASDVRSFASLEPVVVDLKGSVRSISDGAEAPIHRQAQLAAYLDDVVERVPDVAYEYAERRFGLTREMVDRLGIGFDDGSASWDLLAATYRESPRLVVPFNDFNGVPRGMQGRALGEARARWAGALNPEDSSWARYGFFRADTGYEYVLVTEGPGDALAAVSAGFDSIAIRGAGVAGSVASLIAESMSHRPVVICGDADAAGKRFNAVLMGELARKDVDVFELVVPSPFSDLSEWCESSSSFADELQAAVGAARAPDVTPDAALTQMDMTDLAIARGVVDHLNGDLMYVSGQGFMYWTGSRWKRDETNYVRILCRSYEDVLLARADEAHDDDANILRRIIKHMMSRRGFDDVLTEIKALTAVDNAELDAVDHLLSVRNGTIDLRSGTLLPHRREDYLTVALDSFDYNPGAAAPRWTRFLEDVFEGDAAMPSYMQRLIGYGITGSTQEQCFAILVGGGANGKSVLTDTLAHVFREITKTTPFSTFEVKAGGGIPNDIAALVGARLVHAAEGELHSHLSEATLKRLTGQDQISCRFMRQEFFSYTPNFLIMMATNHKPSFIGADEGLWRRVRLIPFKRFFKPEERDKLLTTKLRDEAEGIIAWAVEGARVWYEDGYLKEPKLMEQSNSQYRSLSDRLFGFTSRYELTDSESDTLSVKLIWGEYLKWCDEEGLPSKEIWGRRVFEQSMEEREFPIVAVARAGKAFTNMCYAKESQ
jgi:putative DNA primase/helicase